MYDPYTGRFITKDTWDGDYLNPMSLNPWIYVLDNAINLTDPTGQTPYNRNAAAEYARTWAESINLEYGQFGGSDCTNFVSQALKAGGLPEDNDWFFENAARYPKRCSGTRNSDGAICPNFIVDERQALVYVLQDTYESLTISECGSAWALTDNLYSYLVDTLGFTKTEIKDIPKPDDKEYRDVPQFKSIQKGDLAFYHQTSSDYISVTKGNFNHVAIVIGWGHVTQMTIIKEEIPSLVPQIADHSAPEDYAKPRSINDTSSKVELLVVHIPDEVHSILHGSEK